MKKLLLSFVLSVITASVMCASGWISLGFEYGINNNIVNENKTVISAPGAGLSFYQFPGNGILGLFMYNAVMFPTDIKYIVNEETFSQNMDVYDFRLQYDGILGLALKTELSANSTIYGGLGFHVLGTLLEQEKSDTKDTSLCLGAGIDIGLKYNLGKTGCLLLGAAVSADPACYKNGEWIDSFFNIGIIPYAAIGLQLH